MAFNKTRYESVKAATERSLNQGYKKPYEFMESYKEAIEMENYEDAKAISDVLMPLNYDVTDTHGHINRLKT